MGCVCAKETVEINDVTYYVRRRIGEGGFSVVDLVEDSRTHKLYALKRIKVYGKDDETRAIQEATYHRNLRHPNILPCIDWSYVNVSSFGSHSGEVRILLPFCKGGTLQEELNKMAARGDHFSERYLLSVFRKICSGVSAMHNSKPDRYVHRDLKPGNILLADDGNPIVMDLGSVGPALQEIRTSAEAAALQELASERCSMPYRAPELFHVESHTTIDERTDIWSLGCLLYAMCFHKSPFDAAYERGDSIALAVISGNVSIPDSSKYSQETHDLILSMLSVNAMERPFLDVVLQRLESMLRPCGNREETV